MESKVKVCWAHPFPRSGCTLWLSVVSRPRQNKLRRKVAQECATTAATDDAQRERDLSAGGPIETSGIIKNDLADASGRVKPAAQNDRAGDGRAQSLTTAAETTETADAKRGGKGSTKTPAARSWVEPAGAAGEAEIQQRQAKPAAHETVQLRQYLGNSSEGLIAVPAPGANEAVRGATALSRGGGGSKIGGVGAAGAEVWASTQEQRGWSLVERSLDTARERHRKNEEEKNKRKGEEEKEEEEKEKGEGNEWSIRRKRERLNKSPRGGQSFYGRPIGGGGICDPSPSHGGGNEPPPPQATIAPFEAITLKVQRVVCIASTRDELEVQYNPHRLPVPRMVSMQHPNGEKR